MQEIVWLGLFSYVYDKNANKKKKEGVVICLKEEEKIDGGYTNTLQNLKCGGGGRC